MIHTPAAAGYCLTERAVTGVCGENACLLTAFLLVGLLGLILTTIWKPTSRLATIVLCLINIIVIALCSLILLGLMISFLASDLAFLRMLQMIFVLTIAILNVRTLVYLDILGAITGGERK